jgi:hypothetical protein
MLSALASVDPTFVEWYQLGNSAKSAKKYKVDTTQDALVHLITGKRDKPTEQLSEDNLGYRVGLWNGEEHAGVNLSIRCGGFSPWAPVNACVLSLPSDQKVLHRLLSVPTLEHLLRCLVTAWDPDWGSVITDSLRDQHINYYGKLPALGWVSYLAIPSDSIPLLESPSWNAPMGSGSVIVATEEPFSEANEYHMVVLQRIYQYLLAANILRIPNPSQDK